MAKHTPIPLDRQESLLSDGEMSALAQETGLSPLVVRICVGRGYQTAEEIRSLFDTRLESLKSPHTIKDLDRAVERLAKARESGERVLVYGDYDVDGTTGAALLTWVFRELKINVTATQPDRFEDGYGVHAKLMEKAHQDGAQLVVTVDCGITSFAALKRARELGLDVIVVDHHQIDPSKGLPEAYAVIDPQRDDCPSGLKQICGCGLAFYLAVGLRAYGRKKGWFENDAIPNLKKHLDLVTIATAADMVPVTGDNRILMRHGLEILRYSTKPGVRALMRVSGLESRELSLGQLGFTLGPRINASGRMDSAHYALELLSTEYPNRAEELAEKLEKFNQERMLIQDLVWQQARTQVEERLEKGFFKHAIVAYGEDWHEGVVGIVASRVTEHFKKPAIVISVKNGIGKGSVRTFAAKDVLEALRRCEDLFLGFGGHRHAAGLSIASENLENLVMRFDQVMAEIPEDKEARKLKVDAECAIADLTLPVLKQLEDLGPFGPGNPEPILAVRSAAHEKRVLKEKHLKFRLGSTHKMDALWFYALERFERDWEELFMEGEWIGVPEINRFRGRMTPTLRVRDWRKSL